MPSLLRECVLLQRLKRANFVKRKHPALRSGIGAYGFEIETTDNLKVLCFVRSGKNNWVHVQVNLSNAIRKFTSGNFPTVLQPFTWNLSESVH